jgi:hypothetical protein
MTDHISDREKALIEALKPFAQAGHNMRRVPSRRRILLSHIGLGRDSMIPAAAFHQAFKLVKDFEAEPREETVPAQPVVEVTPEPKPLPKPKAKLKVKIAPEATPEPEPVAEPETVEIPEVELSSLVPEPQETESVEEDKPEPMKEDKNTMWAIYNMDRPNDAWSNLHGWVDTPTFDIFTNEEKQNVSLPVDGFWRKVT